MRRYNTYVVSCVVVSVKIGNRVPMKALTVGQAFTKAAGRWLSFILFGVSS